MRIRPRERKQAAMFGFEPSSSDDESCSPPPKKAAKTPLPKPAKNLKAPKRDPSPPSPPARAVGKASSKKPAPKGKPATNSKVIASRPEDSSTDDEEPAPVRPSKKSAASQKSPVTPSNVKTLPVSKPEPSRGRRCNADAEAPVNAVNSVVVDSPPAARVESEKDAAAPVHSSNHKRKPPPPKKGSKNVVEIFTPETVGSSTAADPAPLSAIQQQLPSAEGDLPPPANVNMRNTIVPAVEWFTMHYVDKVGVPYIFTNGDCGIHFNDGSCMQITGGEGKLSKHLLYVNKNHHYFTVAASNESLVAIPRRLEKKLFAVLWCRQYLKAEKHAKTGVQCKQSANPPRWKDRISSLDLNDPPSFVAAVMTTDGDSKPEFLMSNTAQPYPNDTYYLSGDDRP